MASECGTWIAKTVLCLFNFVFFILGTIVLGTGVWLAIHKASLIALLRVDSENIKEFTQPAVIEQLAYVLIVVGAVIFFISFLGNWGSIRESRCLLSTYGIFMIILLISEITVGGLAIVYKDKAKGETKGFLQSTISKYYGDSPHPDAVTIMWNQMMITFSCCGVDDYHDFEQSAKWNANKGNHTTPLACCKIDTNSMKPLDNTCANSPNENNSNYTKGCYAAFIDWIIFHRDIVIGILLGLAVIHLLAIFLAFCLCKSISKYHGMRL